MIEVSQVGKKCYHYYYHYYYHNYTAISCVPCVGRNAKFMLPFVGNGTEGVCRVQTLSLVPD